MFHPVYPAHNPVHILNFRELKISKHTSGFVHGHNKDWERTLNWKWN